MSTFSPTKVDKIFASVLPIGRYPLSVSSISVIVRLSWLVSLTISVTVNIYLYFIYLLLFLLYFLLGQHGLPLQLRARGSALHPSPTLRLLLHPFLLGRIHLHLSHHRLLGNTRLSQKGRDTTFHCDDASKAWLLLSNTINGRFKY